jgi:predicted ABC-type ATPase
MDEASLQVIVLAGPNGAGKSTAAAHLLPPGIVFVNADEVAKTLPGYPSVAVDIQAGRLVLEQMDALERERKSFAVETTLSSRSLAPRIARLRRSGYWFRLLFLFVPTADLSVQRVMTRVRQGGHSIPEDTIRRRHGAGIDNFFSLYRPLADRWSVHDTTKVGCPPIIAQGRMQEVDAVIDPALWSTLEGMVAGG